MNTRQILKDYKGFSLVKCNGYRYMATHKTKNISFEATSRKEIRKKIDQYKKK